MSGRGWVGVVLYECILNYGWEHSMGIEHSWGGDHSRVWSHSGGWDHSRDWERSRVVWVRLVILVGSRMVSNGSYI